MSDSTETLDIVEPWIDALLTADSALLALVGGISHISGTLRVGELKPPYVNYTMESSRDVSGNAGQIISTSNLYAIKGVAASGSWNEVKAIQARLHALFHRPGQVITTATGSMTSNREMIIQYAEITEGVQYRHLGAVYRIRASRDQ